MVTKTTKPIYNENVGPLEQRDWEKKAADHGHLVNLVLTQMGDVTDAEKHLHKMDSYLTKLDEHNMHGPVYEALETDFNQYCTTIAIMGVAA